MLTWTGIRRFTVQLSWRARLVQQPDLWDINAWGSFDHTTLPAALRPGFLQNLSIVCAMLDGEKGCTVAERFGISPAAVSQKMTRCLAGDEDASPALFMGLVPHHRVNFGERRAPLPSLSSPSGTSFAFKGLLAQLPSLREGLDRVIEASMSDDPYAQRLSGIGFCGEFKRLLEDAEWPRTVYPYVTQTMARNTVVGYMKKRQAELYAHKVAERARNKPDVRARPCLRLLRPLRCVEIDEQKYDAEQSVCFEFNGSLFPLRVARLILLRAICRDTDATLAFHLAAKAEASTGDLLALFHKMLLPWRQPVLETPGLAFPAGAMFPSALTPYHPFVPSQISLDNALIHKSAAVRRLITRTMGATLTLEKPASPKDHNIIEYSFKRSNERVSHRFASTTGSHPHDKVREAKKNRTQPPAVTYSEVIETACVHMASENARPRAKFVGLSPLEVHEAGLRDRYIRFCPRQIYKSWEALYQYEEHTLHSGMNERRPPYIYALGVRYQGQCLYEALGEAKIRIKIYDPDVRTVEAYRMDGRYLGVIRAPLSWQKFAHSRDSRRAAHQFASHSACHAADPLAGYFQQLWDRRDRPNVARKLLYLFVGSHDIAPWAGRDVDILASNAQATWTSASAYRLTP